MSESRSVSLPHYNEINGGSTERLVREMLTSAEVISTISDPNSISGHRGQWTHVV